MKVRIEESGLLHLIYPSIRRLQVNQIFGWMPEQKGEGCRTRAFRILSTFVPMTYTIRTAHFEGPFDLLLFFIERDELDIYDIPIARITDDFLAYIREMESLNIDLASEFILVAATLMRIKAKMLLPRKDLDEQGNEIDPRQELVERLLEYKRYKEVIDDLRLYEERRSQAVGRGNVTDELQKIANEALADAELESLTMFRLLKAFERVMQRFEEHRRVVHTIVRYNYTVLQQQSAILEKLNSKEDVAFEDIFQECENRIHAIVTFLALLELLNMQRVRLTQGIGNNNFWINHRDDWVEEEGSAGSENEASTWEEE